MAHEEALQRWQTIDGGETEIAGEAQWCQIVGEEAVQAVGHGDEQQGIDPPPALVILQHIRRADIEAEAPGIGDHLRQGRHVPEPQIESLPGDGMDRMGRIAHQCQAMIGIARRMDEAQRSG